MIVGLVDKNNDNDVDGVGCVAILHIFASIIVSFNLQSRDNPNRETGTAMYYGHYGSNSKHRDRKIENRRLCQIVGGIAHICHNLHNQR